VLKYQLEEDGLTARAAQSALERVHSGAELDGLRADLVRHLFQIGSQPTKPLAISDQHIPTIYIADTSNACGVTFSECIIDVLDLSDVETAERLPTLRACVVTLVEGVAGLDELAAGKFAESDIGGFSESVENVAAILRLDLPDYTRVTLTVLRKIFVQSGHSRKESALYRGLLSNKQKELIPLVLKNLEKKGAIRKNRRRDATLWAPNLGMYRRVARILDTPTTSKDDLLT
jgi:hypothetical protein